MSGVARWCRLFKYKMAGSLDIEQFPSEFVYKEWEGDVRHGDG